MPLLRRLPAAVRGRGRPPRWRPPARPPQASPVRSAHRSIPTPGRRRCRWCSTDSWFQVRAAAGRSSPQSVSGAAEASVRITDSIVAICGWIIPTPLAMPLTVIATDEPSRPGTDTIVVAVLTTESVVHNAVAAASSPASSGVSAGQSVASPAATRSIGRRVPMIPVDRWSVRSMVTPVTPASRFAISS
jgi:hypothetical protein